MITEDYVSFETSKLLKDKGFTGRSICINIPSKGNHLIGHYISNTELQLTDEFKFFKYKEDVIVVPTLQMAMKWLREEHHLEIYPFHDSIQECNTWWYRIERHIKGCGLTEHESDSIYVKYEQACEAAIKYCLENLI